jgi:hypothetical protein
MVPGAEEAAEGDAEAAAAAEVEVEAADDGEDEDESWDDEIDADASSATPSGEPPAPVLVVQKIDTLIIDERRVVVFSAFGCVAYLNWPYLPFSPPI